MSVYSLISPTIPREKGNQRIYPAAIGAVSKKGYPAPDAGTA